MDIIIKFSDNNFFQIENVYKRDVSAELYKVLYIDNGIKKSIEFKTKKILSVKCKNI